jgi:hypothetical protein
MSFQNNQMIHELRDFNQTQMTKFNIDVDSDDSGIYRSRGLNNAPKRLREEDS